MRINGRIVLLFVLVALGFSLLFNLFQGNPLHPAFNVEQLLFLAIAFLVAIDVHEFGHAVSALLLGDSTARDHGRVTLNPLAHLDPFGTLMILVTFIGGIGIGWGKPVPITPRRIAYGRWGVAIVSVAGVLANLITALIISIFLHLPFWMNAGPSIAPAIQLLLIIAEINIFLAAFNFCIPLPPLDGFNFLASIVPPLWAWRMHQIEPYGPMILLLLVIASQMHILLFNPLQILVALPAQWMVHVLQLG